MKDRLTIIKFNGYELAEKIKIVQDFIIPDLLKNIGFKASDIIMKVDVIKYIINKYATDESGVRNIKRCIEDLFLKINLLRLMKNKDSIEISYKIDNLKFPLDISTVIVDDLLGQKTIDKTALHLMYV